MSERAKPRVYRTDENGLDSAGVLLAGVEFGIDHHDGFHVRVEWEDEPDGQHAPGYWCATLTGMRGCDPIGCGPTKEAALLDLACSIAATSDVFYDMVHPDDPPTPTDPTP